MTRSDLARVFLATVVSALVATSATADYTPMDPPVFPELGHEEILEGIYGGDFTATSMESSIVTAFGNGSLTATRVDDFGRGGVMNVVAGTPGDADDQVWDDGFVSATAAAKYTVIPGQTFGYFGGLTSDTYVPLFDVEGYGFSVTGSMPLTDVSGATWRWGHDRAGIFNSPHSSRMSDNMHEFDWMTAYKVTGLGDGMTTWLLFWEDMFGPLGDYNDTVIEVKAVCQVPVPGAVILGLLGLGVVGQVRRRF